MTEEKIEIIEAIQFDPEEKQWPEQVKPWDKLTPRDMSWGFIETDFGRKHVQAGDWIIQVSTGQTLLVPDRIYKKLMLEQQPS
jgi:hypothetical protein